MSKDPAFLFYPGDWLGGTQLFTRAHKGAYMDILMAQYANGHLPIDDIKALLGSDFDTMWEQRLKSKFKIDENGLFYNEKLEKTMEDRKRFTASRIENLNGKKKEKNHTASHMEDHTDARMENVNESVNENKKENDPENKKGSPRKFETEVAEVIAELNTLASRSFNPASKVCYSHISARLKEGHSVEDLKKVIQLKVYAWRNDPKMKGYIRPSTLFSLENFEDYITEVRDHIRNGTKPAQLRQSGPKSKEEMLEEFRIAQAKKYATQ